MILSYAAMSDLSKLSKQISYILRHAPWEYELELDDEGWVAVDQLLNALNSDPSSTEINRSIIEQMIRASSKQRHELVGDRIRALYGHSIPGKLKRTRSNPPESVENLWPLQTLPIICSARSFIAAMER